MTQDSYKKEWIQEGEGKLPYRMKETKSTNVCSTDIEKKPISKKYINKIKPTTREIIVGSVKKLKHGTLKCFVCDDLIVVRLYRDDKEIFIQELLYKPNNKKELFRGYKNFRI